MPATDIDGPTAVHRPAARRERLLTVLAVVLVAAGLIAVFFAAVLLNRYQQLDDLLTFQMGRRDLPDGVFNRTLDQWQAVRTAGTWAIVAALATLGPGLFLTVLLYRRAARRRAPKIVRPYPDLAGTVRPGADVFVSYAREDQTFVHDLVDHLAGRGHQAWVDWRSIPPTVDWMEEIRGAIASAGTFLFVITPASVHSTTCRAEVDHAIRLGKRIVAVVRTEVPAEQVHPALAAVNWVHYRRSDDPAAARSQVDDALELDAGWVRFHTRLLVRAQEWRANSTDPSYLLVGSDLEEARSFLDHADGRLPRITTVQSAYMAASADDQLLRTRREVRGFYVASLVFGLLQPAVTYAFAFNDISESGLLVLAPLWIIALVFGGTGLIMRRPTLLRSVVIAVGAAVLMVVLYQTLWPLL